MLTVNIHEAKTQLSKLIAKAVAGQPFIIAKAGKPMVKVVSIEAEPAEAPQPSRIGFLKGRISVPNDIKTQFADDIDEMFYGRKK